MSSTTKMMIDDLLINDQKHRYLGVKDDLYQLSEIDLPNPDLQTKKEWNFNYPTLMSTSTYFKYANGIDSVSKPSYNPARNVQTFKDRFYSDYNVLNGINHDNLLIAGSSVGQYITPRKTFNASDVDIFVYGIKDKKEANQRIKLLIDQIMENQKKIYFEDYIKRAIETECKNIEKKIKTKLKNKESAEELYYLKEQLNEVTLSKSIYQNITYRKSYANLNLSHLLPDHFDPVVFQCYVGDLYTIRTKNCITINLDGDSIQIILRLYNTISEILHGFDIGASSVGYDGNQVYFTKLSKFTYETDTIIVDVYRRSTTFESRLVKYFNYGFNIILKNLNIDSLSTNCNKFNVYDMCDLPFLIFSYSKIVDNKVYIKQFFITFADSDYAQSKAEERLVLRKKCGDMNLKFLVNGKRDFYHALNNDSLLDNMSNILVIPPNITINTISSTYQSLRSYIYNKGMVNIKMLKTYFPNIDIAKFTSDLLESKINNSVLIDGIVEQQKRIALDLYEKHILSVDHKNLNWVSKDPTQQGGELTSSVNPLKTSLELWYGKYYSGN